MVKKKLAECPTCNEWTVLAGTYYHFVCACGSHWIVDEAGNIIVYEPSID